MPSAFRDPLSSSPLSSSACELSFSLLLLFHSALSLLISLIWTRFSARCSCSCTAWRHHALFRYGPFSLSGHFFENRPHCICNPIQDPDPKQSSSVAIRLNDKQKHVRSFSNESISVSPEYGPSDYKATSSFVYKRKASRINSFKDVDSGRSDDRDTDSWIGEVYEEETFVSLLDEHRLSGCQCGISISKESHKLIGGKAEEESGSDENGFQHGHCCDIVLRLAKALKSERCHLRNVYVELEEERVAAETATNEAMAMILRLQEEKSALQLEAAHYQRMAEEKSIHDERAIQMLEDDLCKREKERLLLEEELNELREKSAGKVNGRRQEEISSNSSDHKPSSFSGEPHTTTKTGACDMIEEEEVQHSEDMSCIRQGITEDYVSVLSCWDRYPLHTSEALGEQSEMPQLSAEEMDANTLLIQLSALEKQLEASGASKLWDLAQTTQDSDPDKEDASCNMRIRNSLSGNRESIGCNIGEEKVVDIDVANMTSYKADMPPSAEDAFAVQEENMKCKFQESEDCEEEKYLDIPSLVTSNNFLPTILNNSEEACKTHAQYASLLPDGEEEPRYRKITLEDIDSRLQVLEVQTQFMRQQSVPSNYEQLNVVLLKEILQELRVMLHPDQATPNFKEHRT